MRQEVKERDVLFWDPKCLLLKTVQITMKRSKAQPCRDMDEGYEREALSYQ